jgi:large conductance mechanosensitive channel
MMGYKNFLLRGSRFDGFRNFLMRGNLIDLAVAVVIGVAFNAVVQAIVKDIITPLIGGIWGSNSKKNFESYTFSLHGSKFLYGDLINQAISFLVIAAVVYYLIVAPTAKLSAIAQRNKDATDRECPECLSLIPVKAKKCMYCTSEVPPAETPAQDVPRPRRARHLAPE